MSWSCTIAIDKQQDITAYNTSYGRYGYRWGGDWGTDATKQEVVWRGMGVKEVDPYGQGGEATTRTSTGR